MLKIGLTGGIGSGKSTVSDMFSQLGVPVIDTDIIAREIVTRDTVLKSLKTQFGNSIVTDSGSLDRKALAAIVFNDSKQKARLDALLHPLIRQQVLQKIDALQQKRPPYIIIVVPLLFESDFYNFADLTITVSAEEEVRISRVMSRDHRAESDIRSIINHQLDDSVRHQKADYCIDNNSDINHLEQQVQDLHQQLLLINRADE